MKESELMGLLDMIKGGSLGVGISSYPHHDDNNQRIHEGCLELEKRKLIYRKHEETDYVLWMPIKEVL